MSEEIKEKPIKPRKMSQNITYMLIGIILVILGFHGFITTRTLMIFGDQSQPSQYYGFAAVYLFLGVCCMASSYFDIQQFKKENNS